MNVSLSLAFLSEIIVDINLHVTENKHDDGDLEDMRFGPNVSIPCGRHSFTWSDRIPSPVMAMVFLLSQD